MLDKLRQDLLVQASVFYNSDFKDGSDAKDWWANEFRKGAKIINKVDLRSWAQSTLEYLYDFDDSAYYVRDEVETLLKKIIKNAK